MSSWEGRWDRHYAACETCAKATIKDTLDALCSDGRAIYLAAVKELVDA